MRHPDDIACNYVITDEQERAGFDGQLKVLDEVAVPWTTDEKGVDAAGYEERFAPTEATGFLATMREMAGLDPGMVGKARDSFEDYNEFVGIAEKIDYVIGFDWVGDVLDTMGLPDPIGPFKDALEGDWARLGRAIGAIELVAEQERAFCTDMDGMLKSTDGVWEGNAANAVMSWIATTEDKIGGHASDISRIVSRVKAEALTIKSALDTICTCVDKIVECIPDLGSLGDLFDSIGDAIASGGKSAKEVLDKAIGAITKVLDLFKPAFDLVMTAVFAICALCAQITRFADSAWPKTPAMAQPDVNGDRKNYGER